MLTHTAPAQTSGYKMIRGQFFRLLPYQVLLLIVNSVNGIVDGIFASNLIGQDAMAAIGLFALLNHSSFLRDMLYLCGDSSRSWRGTTLPEGLS